MGRPLPEAGARRRLGMRRLPSVRPPAPAAPAAPTVARSLAVMLLAAGCGVASVVSWPIPTAASAHAAAAPEAATQAVIVVLKDQVSDAPPDPGHISQRRSKTAADQRSLLAKLAGAEPTHVRGYTTVNGFAATVTPTQVEALAADPAVAAVVPDRAVDVTPAKGVNQANGPGSSAGSGAGRAPSNRAAAPETPSGTPSATPEPPAGACPSDPAKPLLEPEALQVTRAATTDGTPSAQQLVDGSGVKVAYIADGIDPDNPDLVRPDGSKVIVDYRDFSGEGPDASTGGAEAFGDASAIAAQGRTSYDLADFVHPTHPLPRGCTIRVLGMAPGASIVALKAGGELLPNSAILQAIDWAVTVDRVDVINESFGGNVIPDNSTRDTIQMFNRAAVAAGVTVTVSTGDAGITSTIGSPSTDPGVISVGASTTFRAYAQTGYGAFGFSKGTWADNNISALSSGGFTQGGRTMDLVAPGEAGWALCSSAERFTDCTSFAGKPSPIQVFGGTSQSAPLTAGAAALVIQAYRSSHNGESPKPALVKRLLTSTARDLGLPTEEQGSGLLDARAAVEAALTIDHPRSKRADLASNVVLDPNQLDLTLRPGQSKTVSVGVTNVGTTEQTVRAGTRDFATISESEQTAAIDANSDPTFPRFNGVPWAYRLIPFTVAPGADRLAASIAWQGAARKVGTATVTPVVRLTLIDPNGVFQTNSRPQGGAVSANHALVDVRNPAPGTWTAVIYTIAGASGYTGPVRLATSTQRAVPAGEVTPSTLRLRPGQHGTVRVRVTAPPVGGDTAEAITIDSSGGHTTAVPVIMRSLVPLARHGDRLAGSFGATIIGGNARAYSPAQSFTYAFDVPPGPRTRTLGIGLTLANDPNVVLEGVLVDPGGQAVDVGTNATFDTEANAGTGRTMQLTTADPIAGRWRFVLVVQNPVSGAESAQSFTAQVAVDRAAAVTSTLPNKPTVRIPAGQATTATVTYTNRGVAPVLLQTDARTTERRDLRLVPLGASSTLQLPLTATSPTPAFLAPPGTDRLTLSADSTTPAQVELQAPTGGTDVFGDLRAGQRGSLESTAQIAVPPGRSVAPGLWISFVQQIGPFAGPAPSGTAELTATARTLDFDRDVTSSTGDPWLQAIDAEASGGTPIVVEPGQTVTVSITITPHGAAGRRVSGVLYLVTPPLGAASFTTSGDVLAAVPYSYTTG